LVAEKFSNLYSQYCLGNFGIILNHWVDKVVLKGGKARMNFGSHEIIEKIEAYLFGRTTKYFGGQEIPISLLFQQSVRDVFSEIFFY